MAAIKMLLLCHFWAALFLFGNTQVPSPLLSHQIKRLICTCYLQKGRIKKTEQQGSRRIPPILTALVRSQ